MDPFGKWTKQYRIHLIVVVIFVLYMLSADLLFDSIIPVSDESRSVVFPVTGESGKMVYFLEHQDILDLEWKKVISVSGWAFIPFENSTLSKKYVVLLVENSTYIFETYPITRSDVSIAFSSQNTDYQDSGFYANIPVPSLRDGKYQIGILLKNESASSFTLSENGFIKTGTSAIPRTLSELKGPFAVTNTSDFPYAIEESRTSPVGDTRVVSVSGWAYIPGYRSSGTEKYVIFSSENSTYVFDTQLVLRPDVAVFSHDQTANGMDSGFLAKIPLDSLENGTYRLGILIRAEPDVFQSLSNVTVIVDGIESMD